MILTILFLPKNIIHGQDNSYILLVLTYCYQIVPKFLDFTKYFYLPFKGGTSFADHLCYFCLVFVMLLHLFIAAWSPAGKGLGSCL